MGRHKMMMEGSSEVRPSHCLTDFGLGPELITGKRDGRIKARLVTKVDPSNPRSGWLVSALTLGPQSLEITYCNGRVPALGRGMIWDDTRP